jgi:hypothetical protein
MSRNHAKHNKEACKFIKDSGLFNDWVITTAYYSALHFMQSYLFPETYENPQTGQMKRYDNFDKYFHDTRDYTKHGLLLSLVEEQIDDNDVIDGFTSLKELCWTARYSSYYCSNEIANECYKNLEVIEEYCEELNI